jgi:anti-anti-sigma factor
MADSQFISVEHLPNAVVITILEGSVIRTGDVATVCNQINQLIDKTLVRTYVISFADLTHMSSTFMGQLIAINKKVQRRSGRLVLVNVPPPIREVLTIAQVHRQIPIHDTLHEVMAGKTPAWLTLIGLAALGAVLGAGALWALTTGRGPGFASGSAIAGSVGLIVLALLIPGPVAVWLTRLRFTFLFRREQWLAVGVYGAVLLAGVATALAGLLG